MLACVSIDHGCLLLLVNRKPSIMLMLLLNLMRWHTALELLLLTWIVTLRLQAVKLIVLEQDTLLNHCLIWLGEEVVLLDVVLVGADDFSEIPLQIVALESFIVLLLMVLWANASSWILLLTASSILLL